MDKKVTGQKPATADITDTRIVGYTKLPPPAAVIEAHPNHHAGTITDARESLHRVMDGSDDRVMVVCGPCSIHDPKAALEYAARLREAAARHEGDLLIVMRVYFEKPRTRVGWKGLINDPGIDGTFEVARGLETARRLLLDINALGVPCGSEFLDTVIPQYISDTVTWGAIGARTTESQIHRELASGLSCPVGFKNGTDGNVAIAVDAVVAARQRHHFLAVTQSGVCSIAETCGNPYTHVILRGGGGRTNYDAKSVDGVSKALDDAGLAARVMIDCSHSNSNKDYRRQPAVAAEVAAQIEGGDRRIFSVMLESNLVAGRQDLGGELAYGQSITDGCLGWEDTLEVLDTLAMAARARRKAQ